jgi:ribonuclease BN (tRNA processing enzyme)
MRNRSILFSLLLLLGGVVPSVAQTQIILLGTGTPYPDPHASGPATAVIVGKRVFLFDAGASVMRQVNAAGLPLLDQKLRSLRIFIQITLGYPDLILTSWIMQRRKPPEVYGPLDCGE